jgi:hypothetical protein
VAVLIFLFNKNFNYAISNVPLCGQHDLERLAQRSLSPVIACGTDRRSICKSKQIKKEKNLKKKKTLNNSRPLACLTVRSAANCAQQSLVGTDTSKIHLIARKLLIRNSVNM